MSESRMMNRTWNVTRSGSCEPCGVTQTVIGYGSTEVPLQGLEDLGSGRESELPCGMCGGIITNVRVVGVAVRPFIAREDEDDDGISPDDL